MLGWGRRADWRGRDAWTVATKDEMQRQDAMSLTARRWVGLQGKIRKWVILSCKGLCKNFRCLFILTYIGEYTRMFQPRSSDLPTSLLVQLRLHELQPLTNTGWVQRPLSSIFALLAETRFSDLGAGGRC